MTPNLEKAIINVFGQIDERYLRTLDESCGAKWYELSDAHKYAFGIGVMYCPTHNDTRIMVAGSLDGEPGQIIRSMQTLQARRRAIRTLTGSPDREDPSVDLFGSTITYVTSLPIITQPELTRIVKEVGRIAEHVPLVDFAVN